MSTLAERFKIALSRKPGMRQADLARACGVKTPSVSNWFRGRTQKIKHETARLAASALGCDQNWLAEGVGEPNWSPGTEAVAVLPEERHPALVKAGERETLLMMAELLSKVPAGPRRAAVAGLFSSWAQDGGSPHYIEAVLALLQPSVAQETGARRVRG